MYHISYLLNALILFSYNLGKYVIFNKKNAKIFVSPLIKIANTLIYKLNFGRNMHYFLLNNIVDYLLYNYI